MTRKIYFLKFRLIIIILSVVTPITFMTFRIVKAEDKNSGSEVKPLEETVQFESEIGLMDLIQKVSEITGEVFILDESVKNKQVTIITPKGEINKNDLLMVFEETLYLNGFAIIKTNGFNKIVQKKDIKSGSTTVEIGGN